MIIVNGEMFCDECLIGILRIETFNVGNEEIFKAAVCDICNKQHEYFFFEEELLEFNERLKSCSN